MFLLTDLLTYEYKVSPPSRSEDVWKTSSVGGNKLTATKSVTDSTVQNPCTTLDGRAAMPEHWTEAQEALK